MLREFDRAFIDFYIKTGIILIAVIIKGGIGSLCYSKKYLWQYIDKNCTIFLYIMKMGNRCRKKEKK